MMALGWADRNFKRGPAFELTLWREATTIFSNAGPGGCDPYGMAVTLRRHTGYDHGYYFISTFIEDHLRHHARILHG